ncbi:baseplate wedge protein [Xanthomonas phage X1]|nr:baseplate wedge protein [Xanthomonas phage X1]
MAENKIFSDLDLNMIPNPHTGDLMPKVNQEAIKRSVRHAFKLNAYDIPFNNSIKSSLKHYLFEQNTQLTRAALETDLRWLMTKVEPRIEVQTINIVAPKNKDGFDITITYKIKSINTIDSFNLIVEKIR